MNRFRIVIAILSSVTGLVACSSSVERPRELSATAVPACRLISPHDYAELRLIEHPTLVSGPDLDVGEEGSGCFLQPLPGYGVYINLITNYGINRWIDGDVNGAVVTDVPDVLGYRAVKRGDRYSDDGPHDSCTLYVDLADDQSLKIEVGENSADDQPTCRIARRFAESAMRTLTGT